MGRYFLATAGESRPEGIRTPDQGIMSHEACPVIPEENGDFPKGAASGAAVGGKTGPSAEAGDPVSHATPDANISALDPDLAMVVKRWESLPEAVRAGIVAMVKAASKEA